ncbi:hypothetical protein glysoja_030066 [Glycine soja]|uniref:Uncharacterized protein n=1 Tax=Glycine soja TaxID=3848 RepID=A0A0B2SM52_GLYSO|nr:hypothetical protein glysoja_030066 [Glycine soja]
MTLLVLHSRAITLLVLHIRILLASCSLCFLLLDFSLLKDPEKTAARVDRLLFIASSAPELRSIDFNDSASVAVTVEFPGPKPGFGYDPSTDDYSVHATTQSKSRGDFLTQS